VDVLSESLFWIVVVLVSYIYFGYPFLLLILSKLCPAPPVKKADITPTVSLIIPAYNEEKVIAQKIENALALNYPKDRLEIIVASDGSTDGTNEIVRTFADRGVKLVALNTNQGKTATLNSTIPQARGEIIVFTDANTTYKEDAIRQLVRNFADHAVGCVCGVLHFSNIAESLTSGGLGLYVTYETMLKGLEVQTGSMLFAYGSIYAIKKELFATINPALADDFVVPLDIALRGCRVVQELRAVAYERSATNTCEEFRRTIRMVIRDSRALFLFLPKAMRRNQLIVWELVSHKLLRWLIGLLQLVLFVTNLFILDSYFYQLIFAGQLLFYTIAFVGFVLQRRQTHARFLSAPYFLCMVNAAALVGVLWMALGKRMPVWEKAQSSR
jgi:biofilm PGA synthesis N-glycosyltransferase PgaC